MNTNLDENKARIAEVLDSFKIHWSDMKTTVGTSITLYEFRPAIGTKLSKIRNLKDEFTVALEAESVRIIAPIPGRGTVGIEVPHKKKSILPLSDILNSEEFLTADMELPIALGKTITGEVFIRDLVDMPHLLVAGATGQGKSVGLNVMLMSLLHKKTPDELKLILIDPKCVELSIYNRLGEKYICGDAVTDAALAEETLKLVCNLMDARYNLLSKTYTRTLKEFNELPGVKKQPYYVIVIDEYADLIMQRGKEMEMYICRLAQKARAVGIHLIIATQRPSSTFITGDIKANFTTRIAFRTITGADSRVILDQRGAEKLTGNGDMLYCAGAEVVRVQCAYASIEDVIKTCNEIIENYDEENEENREKSFQPLKKMSEPLLPDFRKALFALIDSYSYASELLLEIRYQDRFHKALSKERAVRLYRQIKELGFVKQTHDKFNRDIITTHDRKYIESIIKLYS